jgi:hypothetical protein
MPSTAAPDHAGTLSAVTVSLRPAPILVLVLVAASAALAGCGGTPPAAATAPTVPPDDMPPAARLAASAALAQDLTYSATYRFAAADGGTQTLAVTRIRDGFSLALTAGERTTATVTSGGTTYRCRITPAVSGCAPGARAADPESDPVSRLAPVFTDRLEVLSDRSAALSITDAATPQGARGTCFSVQGIAAAMASPADPGLYCFDGRGLITAAQLPVGTLTVEASGPAPGSVVLPAPEVRDLPAADPVPVPEQSVPAASAGASSAPAATAVPSAGRAPEN